MNNQNQEIQVPDFLKRETIEKQRLRQEQMRMQQEREAMYANARRNSTGKKHKKRKAELRKKMVSTVLVASASFAIGILSVNGYQQFKGGELIANRFNEYTEGYSITNDSYAGKIVTINGVQVSFDNALQDMIGDARADGMSEVEISIGVSKLYGSGYAKDYIGEISNEEKTAAKYNAYYESKVEDYNKTNGGISR